MTTPKLRLRQHHKNPRSHPSPHRPHRPATSVPPSDRAAPSPPIKTKPPVALLGAGGPARLPLRRVTDASRGTGRGCASGASATQRLPLRQHHSDHNSTSAEPDMPPLHPPGARARRPRRACQTAAPSSSDFHAHPRKRHRRISNSKPQTHPIPHRFTSSPRAPADSHRTHTPTDRRRTFRPTALCTKSPRTCRDLGWSASPTDWRAHGGQQLAMVHSIDPGTGFTWNAPWTVSISPRPTDGEAGPAPHAVEVLEAECSWAL